MLELCLVLIADVPEAGRLRQCFMDACEQIARACCPADPTPPLDGNASAKALQREQTAATSRPNSKWAEKARLKVQQVVPEQVIPMPESSDRWQSMENQPFSTLSVHQR
jgi:hypothetical protein